MFKLLVILIITLSGNLISAYKDNTNPEIKKTYFQIVKNIPEVDKTYAQKLSIIINKVAVKHKIKPEKLTAILAQESRYRLNAVNCHKNGCDFGISQINYKTAIGFKFNIEKLLTDLEYSVEAGAIVLSDFKRMYAHKEPEHWWTRYNSSRPVPRERYKKLVVQYFIKEDY